MADGDGPGAFTNGDIGPGERQGFADAQAGLSEKCDEGEVAGRTGTLGLGEEPAEEPPVEPSGAGTLLRDVPHRTRRVAGGDALLRRPGESRLERCELRCADLLAQRTALTKR